MTDQGVPQLNTPFIQPDNHQIAIPWYEFLISLWNRTNGGLGVYNSTIVPGDLIRTASVASTRVGALLTDGSTFDATQYPALANALGSNILPNIPPAAGITTFIKY